MQDKMRKHLQWASTLFSAPPFCRNCNDKYCKDTLYIKVEEEEGGGGGWMEMEADFRDVVYLVPCTG
jgi:hypothetical protein